MNSLYDEKLLTCLEIGKSVTSTHNLEQIENIILKRLSELIHAQNWSLFLLDPDEQVLKFQMVVGLDPQLLADIKIKVGEGIAGTVAKTGDAIIVNQDVKLDTRFSNKVDELSGFATQSIICLPLKFKGSVIGVLEVVNPEDPMMLEESYLPTLSILSDFVAISIANAQSHKMVEMLSVTDDVTGFHNTRFLHRRLDTLIKYRQEVSLVFLDLDDFKKVVDSHGHMAGSKVLKEIAQVISAQLDENDKLVRYGGDEFIIILPSQKKSIALKKTRKVKKAISSSVYLKDEGHNVKVNASIGIANYPNDCSDKRSLLKMADDSMYRSKKDGKDMITMV